MLDNYKVDRNGVIRQVKVSHISYDQSYVDQRYNTYSTAEVMSYLRLGYLLGAFAPFKPKRILDVGYGNGSFLSVASIAIEECYGYDTPPAYPLSEPVTQVANIYENDYDVVCFFDSLEHFEDIYEIKKLKTKYIYISVPWCHYESDEWFAQWKHRRVDEHLWHFNLDSLKSFMTEVGYEDISHSSVEDMIRKPANEMPNILTAIFRCKK